MARIVLFALVVLALSACGKNTGLVAGPYLGQAPAPYGYAPAPQYGNPYGGGAGYGNFYPQQQMPSGYSNQYYPFMPIHNYMQSNPQLQNYWSGYWGGWQNYANRNGYNQYDFNRFWYDYCPQQWGNSNEWANFYNYYDQNFYYWMTPSTQFSPSASPSYFWQNYSGYSYQPLNNYGYCYEYCY